MAGIKHFGPTNKNSVLINYLAVQLLKPELRSAVLGDNYGLDDIVAVLWHPKTVIYALYEKGLPEPFGVVFFTGVIPYQSCVMYACIFKEEDRLKGKLSSVAELIKKDLVLRYNITTVISYVIGENSVSEHLLTKFGFVESKPPIRKAIYAQGTMQDLKVFHCVLGKEG